MGAQSNGQIGRSSSGLRRRARSRVVAINRRALRPSGNQGMLVSSLAGFTQHHARSARCGSASAAARARSPAENGLPPRSWRSAGRFSNERCPMKRGRDPPHPPAYGDRAGARDARAARLQDGARRHSRYREHRTVPAAAPRARVSGVVPRRSHRDAARSPAPLGVAGAGGCRRVAARLAFPAPAGEPAAHRREPLDLRSR